MECPRLNHFVRLNSSGTVSRCGHMIHAPEFKTLDELESSAWLLQIKEQLDHDVWPTECIRCKQTEVENNTSIRINSIALHSTQTTDNYLQVGGVLDNICNAGCLTCGPMNSTRIGSLAGKVFPIVNNSSLFWDLPQDRILHLDINGGEPSYSKNYKKLLANLPPNLKTLRLNTNCNTVLHELGDIVQRGIEVTVTVSFDGVKDVHDLIRWPITWDNFYNNLMTYKSMPVKLNLWTTVSVLNRNDLPNIIAFAKEHSIDHSYAYLVSPAELSVSNNDTVAVQQYIQKQKKLRNML